MEPRQPAHADKTTPITGAPGFEIRRRLVGYAYARNGNAHNPTPSYQWHLLLNGRLVDRSYRRGTLVDAARRPNAAKLYAD